jgi:hypothetical protein
MRTKGSLNIMEICQNLSDVWDDCVCLRFNAIQLSDSDWFTVRLSLTK